MMKRVAQSRWFSAVIFWVLLANAIVFAAASYELPDGVELWLERAEAVFLGIYVIEMIIRLAAKRFNIITFLRSPANVFDCGIVIVALLPFITSQIVLLRLVRLLRTARLLRYMPDFKILIDGLRRALPPAASLGAITALLSFIWASIGWMMFGGKMPEGTHGYFDNVGEGMLTLFEFLTLEGWNDILRDLREVTPWAIVFVISYILVATYIVVNLVVGIIINALDNAYRKAAAQETTDELRKTILEMEELVERLNSQLGQQNSIKAISTAPTEHRP